MIQGLHASSVVFADFAAVSGGSFANLSRQFPGIDGAGYLVSLNGGEYKLRLGLLHREKHDLVANLDLESKRVPFQSQLAGTVRLREADTRSRTKIIFEGRCARNFGSLPSAASTEAVRHLANDSSRNLLDLLVTALEGSATAPMESTVIAPPTGRHAARRTKAGTKKSDQIPRGRKDSPN
jgi:hypothetical protein